jgi:1-deoxy-D-xylulose-5-phosphate reductoisomerase
MNKGLEVIEAHWLFGFPPDQIEVVIHPESIVHSLVEFVDGSIIAQMGATDMRHAIQYALTYPVRRASCLPPLDLTRMSELRFHALDTVRFPALALAYRALRNGGTLPACLNAANEEAVGAFLDERIRLTDIPHIVEAVMDAHEAQPAANLDVILACDRAARTHAEQVIASLAEGRIDEERTAVEAVIASD